MKRLARVALVFAALASTAHAAKPQIQVSQLGRSLNITFVAPATTSRDYRYFVRVETARQEGCSWKSTSGGKLGSVGQTVRVNIGPNSRQASDFCEGPSTVTVFMQKAYGGFVAKDATPATFKRVGAVRYVIQ